MLELRGSFWWCCVLDPVCSMNMDVIAAEHERVEVSGLYLGYDEEREFVVLEGLSSRGRHDGFNEYVIRIM